MLQPYGRYNNGGRFAGETDFFESLADLKRRFPIDGDRIVIRGFSLGGATAWHLTAHYAADWAASAPGAGFSETRDFLTGFQGEELHPPWWEEKLWQLYDSPAYVENFRNVPLVAYSGEIDRQKQAADVMAKALGAIGIELRHIIGPNTAHAYHPDAITQISALIDPLAARGRETLPRTITVTTPTLKYNRQAWLQIDALDRHWEKSTVTASLKDGGPITVKTLNSPAFTLSFPPGAARQGPPPAVVIDGQPIKTLTLRSDLSWGGSFQVYVVPYPGPGPKVAVSVDGGLSPLWSNDGREVIFRKSGKVIAAPITTSPQLSAGRPVELFDGPYTLDLMGHQRWAIAPDGRFLVVENSDPYRVVLLQNWKGEAKR